MLKLPLTQHVKEFIMFIYTVKLTIEQNSKMDFINYLYDQHLPDVVKTGCFLSSSLELDTTKDELIARYHCENQELFDHYLSTYAEIMRNDVLQKFPTSIIKAERNFCQLIIK